MAWRIRESIAIGIDLGTTNSCVGVWRDNRVEIIANDQGNRTTPSYAAFRKNERFIGDAEKIEAIGNPANTVFDAKRLIGRRFSDPSVQSDKKLWPFKVIEGNGDRPNIIVDYQGEEKKFTAEEISAMILAKLKEEAEAFLGCTVKDAVVTVPAYFNDAQRQATKDAGAIAGLNVMRLMDEPTAAAVAYGFGINKVKSKRNVLVFDLGGGTLDVSLVKICKGVIEVKATAGDTHLGGEDFDNRLVLYMFAEFKRKQGKDVSSNPKALRRLKTACEQAKRSLSTTIQTVIDIDCLFEGIDFYSRITRARFEDLNTEEYNINTDLFTKCIETVARCHEESGIDKESIDAIVLAGGSTRIPKVQQLLRSYYSGKEICKSIHPDEAIACGAAIQAARLTGQGTKKMRNLVVTGVTPLSLGIELLGELLGEIMDVIIPKNTPILTKRSKVYSTTTEYQVGLDIRVYEGERVLCKDNNLLGQFLLTFPPEPSGGETRVRISFKVDHDGILHISAKELVSGWKNQLTMVNREGRLTKEEMNRMVWEGERNRIEDELFKKKFLAKNSLEENAYSLRKLVKDNHHIISKEKSVNYIAEAVSEIIEWMHDDVLKDVSEYDLKKREIVEMRIALCEFLP